MRVTNRGSRKWEVSPGVIVRPGQSADVTLEGWRLALALNPAMPYAVASGEIAVEEEAPPVTMPELEREPEPEPADAEPVSEVAVTPTRRKRGRR